MARTKKVKEILDEIKGTSSPEPIANASEIADALSSMGFEVPEELLKPERVQEPDIDIDTPAKPDDGFDMNSFYQVGDTIYLVRFIDYCDIQEVKKLKVRTVYKRCLVACEDKGGAVVIGKDMIDNDLIFDDPKAAKEVLADKVKEARKRPKKESDDEIPSQLIDEDGDVGDGIDNYMDGDSSEE